MNAPDPEPGSHTVSGEIVLPPGLALPRGAVAVVRLENISRADAPAETMAEHRTSGSELAGATAIPFRLELPSGRLDQRALYSVSAHIDVTGSGRVESGDLITTQTYPVLTRGYPSVVRLSLKRV